MEVVAANRKASTLKATEERKRKRQRRQHE